MSPSNVPPADPGNAVVAHTLHWLAVLLEIDGGDTERIAGYRQAALRVRQLDQPLAAVARASGAAGLERLGFTPAISVLISDWIKTGELPVIDGAASAGQRPGLWPALTRALYRTLGIEPAGREGERKAVRRDAAKAPARRLGARGPIHRQVWESWS